MTTRVLITGATGFIGRSLARSLLARNSDDQRRYEVFIAGRPAFDVTQLRDVEAALFDVQPHWVWHCAAIGASQNQGDVQYMRLVNEVGTRNVVDVANAVSSVQSIVVAGSSSEYGANSDAPDEESVCIPNSAYGITKLVASTYAAENAKTPTAVLRLYSVYGDLESPKRLIPQVIACGRQRRYPPFADLRIAHDFVHVSDVFTAFLAASCQRAEGIFNIGSGVQTTLGDVARAAQRLFRIEDELQAFAYDARPWDTHAWRANIAKARAKLLWAPRFTDFAQGLQVTAQALGVDVAA